MTKEEVFCQIIIALITTTLGSILTYLKSKKEFQMKLKEVEIKSATEISKIKEEAKKELEKIKAESEELIKQKIVDNKLNAKEKENELLYSFAQKFIDNPKMQSMIFQHYKIFLKKFHKVKRKHITISAFYFFFTRNLINLL